MGSLFQRGLVGPNSLINRLPDALGRSAGDGIYEYVTLINRGPGDSALTTTVNIGAYRRVLDINDARVAEGHIPAGSLAFHLLVSTMSGSVPSPHDQLTDSAGVNYSIGKDRDAVRFETAGNWYRCEVVKEI